MKLFSERVARWVLWGAFAYLMLLVLGFSTVFSEAHLSTWLELLLKATIVLGFLLIVGTPFVYAAARFRKKMASKALGVTAIVLFSGYAWLFARLVYVKFKTCDTDAIPWDPNWYCHVEGKHIVFYVVIIPFFAALCGVITEAVLWTISKIKKK